MPIYAYKCNACGHAQDILQKMSDPVLTQCPRCNADAFSKQVTAAGFQLKGSGWYVTDFRGGNTASKTPDSNAEKADSPSYGASGAAATSAPDATPAAPSGPASPAAPAASPATPAATKTVAAHAPSSGAGA